MFGHDSKSEIGKSLRCWVKAHKLEEFYQLLLWDVDDFAYCGDGVLSSYMKKEDSRETFHMTSRPPKQMYHLR